MLFQPRSRKAQPTSSFPQRLGAAYNLEALEERMLFSAPTMPTRLRVTASTSSSITLQWTPSADDGRVTGYRIYRNGVKVHSSTAASFTDRQLSPGTRYVYTIRAADDEGLFSRQSLAASGSTRGVSSASAFAVFSAARFDAASGVEIGSREIRSLDDGDWAGYRSVQFGRNAQSIRFNFARGDTARGATVEIRLDSPDGTLVGTHEVQPTGGDAAFVTQYANISATSGLHDVYLVFRGGSPVGHLRSFAFSDQHLTRIMPLGDSITHAFTRTPSYRWFLWHDLLRAGLTVDFVGSQTEAIDGVPPRLDFDQNHEGHTGLRADELADQARGWAEQAQPEIVLLHAGSNDIEQGQDTDSTITDLAGIIREIRAANPNVTILFAQLLPDAGHEEAIDELNARIPGLAADLNTAQSRVIVVDMNTGFSLADLQDESHLNRNGESKMAGRWLTALRRIL